MKNTVDLTEDRMFPDQEHLRGPSWLVGTPESFNEVLRLLPITIFLPWEFDQLNYITSDEGFVDWRYRLDGSAKDYRQREEWHKADSDWYCDRCGKPIRTPWRLDRTLCIECARQLDIDVNSKKVPWDNNDFWSTIITTGIRFGG